MKKIILCLLLISCIQSKRKNFDKNSIEFKDERVEKLTPIHFTYDDFSSEGNEGSIFFYNDTLIAKIKFSFATSMQIIDQEYIFTSNELSRYKQKISYLKPDKSGYIQEDSIDIKDENIFMNDNFDKILYERLIKTAVEKNPYWNTGR